MTGVGPKIRVVFIAGSSHSGSTMLGLILGAAPGVVYCGEINQYRRAAWRDRPVACTCGSEYGACPLWSRVYDDLPHGRDLNPAPGFSITNLRLLLSILVSGERKRAVRRTTQYGAVIEAIHRHAASESGQPIWIVDSSKSLNALDALWRSDNLDLRVIHLLRDSRGVAASFLKRGRSPLAALAAWTLVNTGLILYIRRCGIPCLRVSYRSLCESVDTVAAEVHRRFGLQGVTGDILTSGRHGSYHLMRANRDVRRVAAGEREFEGLRYHGDATGLSPMHRFVARLVTDPIYRFLVSGKLAPNRSAFR